MKTHIICPKCKKTLKVMSKDLTPNDLSTIPHFTMIGRCEECDYDATWDQWDDGINEIVEINVKQYFFG